MKKRIKLLLENVIEESMIALLLGSCAVSSIVREIDETKPRHNYNDVMPEIRSAYPISEGDLFLFNEQYADSLSHKETEEILYSEGDVEKIAEVIFTEAGICEEREQIAVAYTIINRKLSSRRQYGRTFSSITSPKRYNGMGNLEDISELKIMYPEKWDYYKKLAKEVLDHKIPDPTNGATHFYKPSRHRENPETWNMNKMEEIGKISVNEEKQSIHKFYREIY